MLNRKCYQVAVTAVALGMLGTGFAYAQMTDDPMRDCEGLYDAYTNYSSKLNDPDKAAADAMAEEGLNRCKNDKTDEGMKQINHAIGAMHDGKPSKT
jgi:hypothetical protein